MPAALDAPVIPDPVVIGDPPAMPSALGEVPRTPGAMSGFAVPDTALDGAELAGLTIRSGSLRGEAHREEGELRQDSMGTWQLSKGPRSALLVCVADGLGSAEHSHRGAVAACQLLRDLVSLNLEPFLGADSREELAGVWYAVAAELAETLKGLAERQGLDPKDLSTTLCAALVDLNSAAERKYAVLAVGDSTAFLLQDGQFTRCLPDPHEGDITDNSTWSLPNGVREPSVATGTLGKDDMLMVCTDGMSNPMREAAVRDQLSRWWADRPAPSLLEFGWQLSYQVTGYSDDRTAICVWGG